MTTVLSSNGIAPDFTVSGSTFASLRNTSEMASAKASRASRFFSDGSMSPHTPLRKMERMPMASTRRLTAPG